MNRERTVWAQFTSEDDLVAAARALHERSRTLLEAFSPYPLPELDGPLRLRRPVGLSRLTFIAACVGGALAFLIIWWTSSVDYPLNVGGRPLNSIVADIPIVFESSVLAAAVAAFAGFLWSCGLPRLTHDLERRPGFRATSVDRFWLGVRGPSNELPDLASELRGLGAVSVESEAEPES